jgi:hypothetical protein
MSATTRIVLAATVILVLAAGGAYLALGAGGDAATVPATPSRTAEAVSTATPLLPVDELPIEDTPLAAGRYRISEVFQDHDARVAFTVPDGWTSHEWWVSRAPILTDSAGVALAVWSGSRDITTVYPDPCRRADSVPAGTSAADLVAALIASPLHSGEPPAEITVSGYSGTAVRLSIDPAANLRSCLGGHLTPWVGGQIQRWVLPGTQHLLWILDVDDRRLVIDASTEPNAEPSHAAELSRVLDSLEIQSR